MTGSTRVAAAEQVAAACRRAGLRVVGPTDPATGMDGAVVAHPFTSARLDELDESIYRTVPTGRDHTIVVLRRAPVPERRREVREVLTVEVLAEECDVDCAWIDDEVAVADRWARFGRGRDLLEELPEGFEIERVHFKNGTGPRGFELALFDVRGRPRRRVASVTRRYIGRPLVGWQPATVLADLDVAVAFSVMLRLAAS